MTRNQGELIETPASGLLVFDITTNNFWYSDGHSWHEIQLDYAYELSDGDRDTKVQVEESYDEDIIRFDLEGVEKTVLAKNESDLYSLRYAEFVVPLVKAVQELSAQNAILQQTLTTLLQEVKILKDQINEGNPNQH